MAEQEMKKCLFGFGGHAHEVASFIEGEVVFFTDENIKHFNPKTYKMMVAIGGSINREKIVKKLPKEVEYFTFIHPNAIVDRFAEVGIGSFIGAGSIITTNVKIGDHFICNRLNSIGHDVKIGNFCSLMPGAVVSGNVEIGNRVYIGSNAVIREKISICDDVIIGAGAVVIKDINESGTYVGVPCKKIK